MSLFDLQDVCIAIGSLATLDLPMVVDLIGIYVLKGPYCTLTTINWFLQALSVIPRGSWGDVARRFTMIASHGRPSTSPQPHGHTPPLRHHAPSPCDRTCSDRHAEVIPSVANPSSLLVQIDGGRLIPVVDLIGGSTAAYREEPDFPCEFLVGARRLDASKLALRNPVDGLATSWWQI
ncbi:formin-like protein 3 [Dorcoceras hygrometricum]|uniref:Formin-like protein 3 n=1 Tax=Dorcoceras hygrometricum TaxID=472368 RepID=A0A2Z7D0G1_9LAMI|nr:formin-like protein 3 [Dorcoceras hygrometricum]